MDNPIARYLVGLWVLFLKKNRGGGDGGGNEKEIR
jgi:hypothetical protein